MRRIYRARRWAVRGLTVLFAFGLPLSAQQPAQPPAAAQARAGVITGLVRDEAGTPLAEARVSIDSGARQVLSAADGRFTIEGVPAGRHSIVARKLGYRPTSATITVPPDTVLTVNIRLIREPQRLEGVLVEAELVNQLSGIVMDEQDRPLEGVTVELLGLRERVVTKGDGLFLFSDLPPGLYLLQWRKPGYAVAQHGLRVEKRGQRDFAVRLGPAADQRYTAELAEVVGLEATRRQGMAGSMAAVVGREELEAKGSVPLSWALLESSGGVSLRDASSTCVLVDGHEVLSTVAQGELNRAEGGGGGRVRGGGSRGGSAAAPAGSWLNFFRADEVELVEIFPPGTENSRTLCGRFPPSSGCSCPPMPSGIVIWLKK